MKKNDSSQILKETGLKITPQRLLILELLYDTKHHPTADFIIGRVQKVQPGISPATVYKTLDTLVLKGLIRKIYTEDGKMRYDPVSEHHHHLHNKTTGEIKDYYDEELNDLLQDYFDRKKIPGFHFEGFHVEINGQFNRKTS